MRLNVTATRFCYARELMRGSSVGVVDSVSRSVFMLSMIASLARDKRHYHGLMAL